MIRAARAWLPSLSVVLALALAGTWAATSWLAIPWQIEGPSMEPTLRPGDRVLVDLWSYRQRPPRRGEIALLRSPGRGAIVKRVEAVLPGGDRLRVLGDNPRSSLDSRQLGPVPVSHVLGRVFWRFWPPRRFGRVGGERQPDG